MKKSRLFSRIEKEVSVDTRIGRNLKRKTVSKREAVRLAKIERDEEKKIEIEKHEKELKLQKKREVLSLRLLERIEKRVKVKEETEIDDPVISWNDIGKTWIFSVDSNGNRTLNRKKGNEMKFTGEELMQSGSEAIEEILLQIQSGEKELNTTKIHQALRQEISELHDEEIAHKISLCYAFERFFVTQRIALLGLSEERKALAEANREFKLAGTLDGKKSIVMETARKFDKKFDRQISSGLSDSLIPDKNKSKAEKLKWEASKLKSSYTDLMLED